VVKTKVQEVLKAIDAVLEGKQFIGTGLTRSPSAVLRVGKGLPSLPHALLWARTESEEDVRLELVLSVSPKILEEGNIQQNRSLSKPSVLQGRRLARLCHVRMPSPR